MIAVVEIIKAVEGKTEELRNALKEIVPICQKEMGCLQYELFEPVKGNGEFLVFMKYKSQKDLERHETSKFMDEFVRKYDGIVYSEVIYHAWKPV